MVLANALEKAGTGAFSDSGADLIPEILKFELKLTLKLTLRLISRSRIEESDLLEGAGLLVVEVVVVGASVVVDLLPCESLSSSSLARRELIVDKLQLMETFLLQLHNGSPPIQNGPNLDLKIHLQIPWKKQSMTLCLSLCLASWERDA